MAEPTPEDVTLNTLHEDLSAGFTDLKGEVRGGFADMKATLVAGFRNMPTREDSQEMIRLLRENNRIQEERFTQLDLRIREQHLGIQQVLRSLAEGQRALHEDIRALIARIDALIKGRGDGSPPPTS